MRVRGGAWFALLAFGCSVSIGGASRDTFPERLQAGCVGLEQCAVLHAEAMSRAQACSGACPVERSHLVIAARLLDAARAQSGSAERIAYAEAAHERQRANELERKFVAAEERCARERSKLEDALRAARTATIEASQQQAEPKPKTAAPRAGVQMVKCVDGSRSPTCRCDRESFRGCCSHHGGVDGCD